MKLKEDHVNFIYLFIFFHMFVKSFILLYNVSSVHISVTKSENVIVYNYVIYQ